MWRSLILAVLLYGTGHPGLEAYRPQAFDRPLREFHREVNAAGSDSRRALRLLDDARSMRHLQRGAAQLRSLLTSL